MRNLENRAWNFRTTEGPKRRLPQLDYMIMLAQFIFLFPFSDDLLGDVTETAGQFSIFPAKKHQVWQLSINQSMCVGVRGPVEKFQHTARAKTTWDLILWRGKRNSFTAAMVTLPQSSTAQCPEDTLSPWFFQRGKVRAFECLTPPAVQEAAKGTHFLLTPCTTLRGATWLRAGKGWEPLQLWGIERKHTNLSISGHHPRESKLEAVSLWPGFAGSREGIQS